MTRKTVQSILDRSKNVAAIVAAGLALLVPSNPSHAKSTEVVVAELTIAQRVTRVREQLRDRATSEAPLGNNGQISQWWPNWPNWPNWGNWGNWWNNWRNW